MDCLNTNCNISTSDRMITCWLCLGNYHLKCTTLKARDADAIADQTKSLQWSCAHCRKINIEFYKFFKSYKEEFEDINKNFLALQSKLSKFGDLFTKFLNLDNFIDNQNPASPKIKNKKKNDKSPAVPLNYNSSNPIIPNGAEINESASFPSTSTSASVFTPQERSGQTFTTPTIQLNNHTSTNATISNTTIYNPLRAIPSKKNIFVSRLASVTSTDDVDYYIRSKVGSNADIRIHKFIFSQPRSIASFKITVSADIFNILLDPNFWPINSLVREYKYKERPRANNIGVLPERESNIPKN